jgi:hypothetical protein
MKFVHPNFLYALFLLVIPIIIHLFNFRKHKTIYFSNIRFLKKLTEQTKSISKIKHWIVLALRLLAFASLIIAFARPYIPLKEDTTDQESIIAIYVDNSGSMQMMSEEGILLSKANQIAKNIINQAPIKTRFLISDNNFNGTNQRIVSKSDALDLIDQIKISRKFKSVEAIYSHQNNFLKEKNLATQSQFIWISDYQKSTLSLPLELNKESLQKITPIKINAVEKANLFIDSIWFKTPVRRVNQMNELYFRIKNTGNKEANSISISFNKPGTKRSISINVPAEGEAIGQLSYIDKKEGIQKCQLSVNDKHVRFDDEFYFSYELKKTLNISIISGEHGIKKIARLFQFDSSNVVYEASVNQINASKLESSNLIILNEIDQFSSGLQRTISDFVARGGSVCILPSIGMNISSFNSWLTEQKLPVFSSIKDAEKVRKLDYENPFFDHIFYKKDEQINLPELKKHYKLITYQQERFQSLLTYSSNQPFFIKSSDARRSIYLASSGASIDFGSFGSHALFSTILLRISELSYTKNPLYLTPKSEQIIRINRPETDKNVIKASLEKEQIGFIPYQVQQGSLTELFMNKSGEVDNLPSENYDLKDGNTVIGSVSLNSNMEESNLSTYSEDEITLLLNQSGFQNVQPILIENSEAQVKIKFNSRKEYWRILLILALIFLALEIVVIKLLKN